MKEVIAFALAGSLFVTACAGSFGAVVGDGLAVKIERAVGGGDHGIKAKFIKVEAGK